MVFNHIINILSLIAIGLFESVLCQTVRVRLPLDPYFVVEGDLIRLNCFTTRNLLQWEFQSQIVDPYQNHRYTIRDLYERPRNFSESNLTVAATTLSDTGTYACSSKSSLDSFQVYVTVLNIESGYQHSNDSEVYTLQCEVSGFLYNPPEVQAKWVIETNKRYNITPDYYSREVEAVQEATRLKLKLKNPRQADMGNYSCEFKLITRDPHTIFSKTIHLNVDISGSLCLQGIPTLVHTLFALLVFLVPTYFW